MPRTPCDYRPPPEGESALGETVAVQTSAIDTGFNFIAR